MTETAAALTSYGDNAMAEQDLCRAVGEDLTRAYPGYDWACGVSIQAGTVVIDLICDKPPALQYHQFMLHLKTLVGPGGQKHALDAGGELLERYGLPRDRAPEGWQRMPALHGIDTASMVGKSRF